MEEDSETASAPAWLWGCSGLTCVCTRVMGGCVPSGPPPQSLTVLAPRSEPHTLYLLNRWRHEVWRLFWLQGPAHQCQSVRSVRDLSVPSPVGSSPPGALHRSGAGPGPRPPLARAHVHSAWSVLSSGVRVSLGVGVSGARRGWGSVGTSTFHGYLLTSRRQGWGLPLTPCFPVLPFSPWFFWGWGQDLRPGCGMRRGCWWRLRPLLPRLPSRPQAPACEVSRPCLLTLLPWVPSEATAAPPSPPTRHRQEQSLSPSLPPPEEGGRQPWTFQSIPWESPSRLGSGGPCGLWWPGPAPQSPCWLQALSCIWRRTGGGQWASGNGEETPTHLPPWARTFHASYIRPLQAMDVLAPPLTPNHPDLLAPPGGGQKGSWGGGCD